MNFFFYGLLIFGVAAFGLMLVSLIYVYTLHRKRLVLWAEIQEVLRERYDFVPRLLEVIEPFFGERRDLLENLKVARRGAMRAKEGPVSQSDDETRLSIALSKIMLYGETLPPLHEKNDYFLVLQEFETISESLRSLRRKYNEVSDDLNKKKTRFPFNLVAPFFGYQVYGLFQPEEDRSAALATNLDKQG